MKLESVVFRSLADAKAKFSQVVDDSKRVDIVITKNGVPAAVVMNYDRYVKLMKFLDEVRDLYLLEVGDPSVREIDVDLGENEEV